MGREKSRSLKGEICFIILAVAMPLVGRLSGGY